MSSISWLLASRMDKSAPVPVQHNHALWEREACFSADACIAGAACGTPDALGLFTPRFSEGLS
jgi:hypothetical protein